MSKDKLKTRMRIDKQGKNNIRSKREIKKKNKDMKSTNKNKN